MSSVVYVGVGQCGNQVLESLINYEFKVNRPSYDYLLYENEKLRCVFVDSESKVLNKIKAQSSFKSYIRDENIISGLNGRGSNWCYGYNGCKTAPNITANVLEGIRKEIERCDNYMGIVMCHSLGGGTGSGFGSKLTELIRDEFQLQQIINCSVAPSDVGGDNPLQYYNCLLSMATLSRNSDGILLFHNDSLINQLGVDLLCPIKSSCMDNHLNRRYDYHSHKPVSVESMNSLIAMQIGSLFSPCSSIYPWNDGYSHLNIEINEFIRSLCVFPDMKTIRCVSSSLKVEDSKDWTSLGLSVKNRLNSGYGKVSKTVSAVCCYRGAEKRRIDRYLPSISLIQKQLDIVNWNKTDSIDVWIDRNPKEDRQITLAFNSGCIADYLRLIVDRSREKYLSSAYLHSYYRFGGSKEIFLDSFEEIEKVISNYLNI